MYFESQNSIIQPRARDGYQPIDGYPKHVIIGHSVRWPQIIKNLQSKIPGLHFLNRTKEHCQDFVDFTYNGVAMRYAFAPEGTIGIQTEVIRHALRGADTVTNIGCAGGLDPSLVPGDPVICTEAIRDSGFGRQLATPDEKAVTSEYLNMLLAEVATELFGLATLGKVWCVDTLYYTFAQLQQVLSDPNPPILVEMELEAGAISAGWVNANDRKDNPVQYAQIGYVSDNVPLQKAEWQDPFKPHAPKKMVPWKEQALRIALAALERA